MSEIEKFSAQEKKLENICEKNNLLHRFNFGRYPITISIRPNNTFDNQLSMMENVEEEGFTSPDACIRMSYIDGEWRNDFRGTFTINDSTLNKIKNISKKAVQYYQQFFFRDIMERTDLPRSMLPRIEDVNDMIETDAFEEYEDDDPEDYPESDESVEE